MKFGTFIAQIPGLDIAVLLRTIEELGFESVWVANSGDGSVSRIDTAQNLVIATIPNVGVTPWGLAVAGGAEWGLASPHGFAARELWLMAGAGYLVLPHWSLGMGARARFVSADAPAPSTSPPSLHGFTSGLVASVRYEATLGPLTLAAGPQIEALIRPVIVQLDGAEIFRVPTWVLASRARGRATSCREQRR